MKMYKAMAVITLIGLFGTIAKAQSKVAHINSAALIEAMHETRAADVNLKKFEREMQTRGETMVAEVQKKIDEFKEKAAGMSENVRAAKTKEIELGRQIFQEYEVEMGRKVAERQSELYQPIFKKAHLVIEEVAKEKGYDYVLDSSVSGVLVAPPAHDLMAAAKVKLGIPVTK